jgi:beta-glucosidase
MLKTIAPSLIALALASAASAQSLPYQDPKLPAAQRAADLVGRMTLEEKAGQLRHAAPAIPRLSVPAYNWWNEGLHGVARAGEATVFPQAIGMAATWDAPFIHEVADTIATEFRAKYLEKVGPDGSTAQYRGLTVWSPNINIFRDPRWGRGQETWGEDPFLTATLGSAFVEGLQGPDLNHLKTLATAKHFAVHSGPEADRHRDDIHPSRHDLEDTYLPAFEALITKAKAQAVMCAYNAVDGQPACASDELLKDRLRGTWKFDGHVVSDCAAIADVYLPTSHAYRKTPAEAFAVSLKAGTDLLCDFGGANGVEAPAIVEAVRTGLVTEAEVDVAMRRLFEARMRLGLFDPAGTGPYGNITAADNDTPAHRALALKAAQNAMVLLKNDGLLPLKAAPKSIAVIGPNADSVDALVGNYNGVPSKPITVLAGIRARFPDANVTYVQGTGLIGPPSEPTPDAIFCQDAACATKGLKVEEFAGLDFAGAPTTRTETNAGFSWGRPTRAPRQTSIRWSGFVTPKDSGPHSFAMTGERGWRVKIDGQVVADAWDTGVDPAQAQTVMLTAGKAHAITIEARQDGDRGEQRLTWSQPSDNHDTAIAAAKGADLVVFVGGLSARIEGEEMPVKAPGFAGGDRTSLDLPAPQEKLLEGLQATGKPVVLVLVNGSAMSVNWADKTVPAIVEAWYPGGEGGKAVAGLLAGDFSPAGRLPVTFYRSADQLPAFKDYTMAGRTYRYFGGEALYPFGYGLSYTTFKYGKPVLSAAKLKAGQPLKVSVEVTNAGGRDGDEVAQLYVTRPGQAGAPIRALKGFQRVTLKTGETRKLDFTLDAAAFATIDADGQRAVKPGAANLWIGGGQPVRRPGLSAPAGVAAKVTIAP